MRLPRNSAAYFALILALCVSTFPCRAQDFHGSLVGTVSDASGARVPSAVIIIQASESSMERRANTNDRGEFRLADLAPGTYRVTVQAPGFADANSTVIISVSTVRDISVVLNPASSQQQVNVSATPSSITSQPMDTTTAVNGGVVTARDLTTLPLAERSFANIAYLVPGTEPVEPSDPTKARVTAVSFGGSSGLNDVLSVDGMDNSDDYIGGFLQNFSPDAIQEFAVQTSQQDADIGRAVGGSVEITTKSGTNQWHGGGAFYERAAALNARYPIENPPPLPKQPFSKQNYIGTLGGPIIKDKLWFFASIEEVRESASIAYSPASLTQFNALAGLASQGLIPGVSSIPVPNNVPIPFRDNLGDLRFDWAESTRSTWFLRTSVDSYVTDNALIQQATLPSTGATSHNNYFNAVLGQQYIFSPTWLGSLTLGLSYLHLTEARNSNLGFALAFPFSSTSQTISGFETFGDNQFVTPITAFPILRNQEKYQIRYNVTHTSGTHSPSFGVDFIHEPVLSGALPANAENLTIFAQDPTAYAEQSGAIRGGPELYTHGYHSSHAGDNVLQHARRRRQLLPKRAAAGIYAQDSWRVTSRLTINYGLRYDTSFGLFTASGQSQLDNPALLTLRALQVPLLPELGRSARLPAGVRAAIGNCLCAR